MYQMKCNIGLLGLTVSLIILISCNSTSGISVVTSYAPNAKLILNQNLTIPANTTGVYIQGGRVVTAAERDQYHPNCRLIVNDLKDTTQEVKADEFTITRILFNEDYVSRPMPRYASAGNLIMIADGGASPQDYASIFYLSSTRQPNVTELVCTHWEDPPVANHLTLKQIQTTLGEIINLK